MDYRSKPDAEDSDSDHDNLPHETGNSSDVEKEEDEGPTAKRAAHLWGDALMEQGLLHKGSHITLERNSEKRVIRGVESYDVPKSVMQSEQKGFKSTSATAHCDVASASTDDPFGDSAIDLNAETAFCERLSDEAWDPCPQPYVSKTYRKKDITIGFNASRARGKGPYGRKRYDSRAYKGNHSANLLKRSRQDMNQDRDKLLLSSYSLETLMAVEFDSNISIEQLGDEMAMAMGERDPQAVKTIVRACGMEKNQDRDKLLLSSYSLETLMAVEFDSNISIEQLGDEMAMAMGERDPQAVKTIVRACGMEKALSLFEEARKVESTGGMMIDNGKRRRTPGGVFISLFKLDSDIPEDVKIDNGKRRRTPGGVFISLFKLDSDIPEDVKKRVFGENKQEARKLIRARRKHFNFAGNVAKLAELMKKEKEKDMNSLKPLPLAEDLLQESVVEEDIHISKNEDVEDGNMDL
ncbi:hypothetical protein DICVIV_09833 [Dictyocaulus viviparus]|uniref:Phosphorylated adapter RNA export protein n=1 Tax=Dictyocaulus viviparus TaxID=29172 RepID=A0A0D8XK46_DICVI|nr:hypothetical protein DICVIV_09833 [Dictyocaulus viviparus]